MRNELDLKGNELLVYALIYGFSQDGASEFSGSNRYIADWIGASRQTVNKILKTLCDKGLLNKRTYEVNGVVVCTYQISLQGVKKIDRGCQKTLQGVSKNLTGGCQKTLHNNYIDNNNDIPNNNNSVNKNQNYENVDNVIQSYNDICTSLPRCMRATSKRRNKIAARLKTYTLDDFRQAFFKSEKSDFLSGRSKDWKANLDWFVANDENLAKVLEGRYDNMKGVGFEREAGNGENQGHSGGDSGYYEDLPDVW